MEMVSIGIKVPLIGLITFEMMWITCHAPTAEHLWEILERCVRQQSPISLSKHQMWEYHLEEWHFIHPVHFNRLGESMVRSIKAVRAVYPSVKGKKSSVFKAEVLREKIQKRKNWISRQYIYIQHDSSTACFVKRQQPERHVIISHT